jgi:hypothetical protein
MKRFFLLATVAVSLSGCGMAVRMEAHSDLETSKAAYKSCLAANPANVSACESLRLAYEADLKAFEATAGGVSSRDP